MVAFIERWGCVMRHAKFLTLLLALYIASSASGAATQPPQNIAVVSLFNDTLHKIRVGLTVFDNTFETKDVSAWNVPETSEADMVALLKQKGVAPNVSPLPAAIPRVVADDRGAREQLIAAARDAGFDTLVVVLPTEYDNARFLKPGYGVFASGGLFGSPKACPYGLFIVAVYRTADGDRIDWRWGFSSWGDGPCVGLGSVPWKATIAEYSDEDWVVIQSAIRTRIHDGMARALDGLDFQ